jgi:predicted dehydrogenase
VFICVYLWLKPLKDFSVANKPLGIGIVGTGLMGSIHAECFAREKDARLVAFQSRTRSKAEELAAKHGGQVFDTVDKLLASPEVDAVVIASPQAHHRDQALAAVRAGKHVLCEKPLALTVKEMDEIAAAAKKSRVTFAVGHQMRFHPVILAVKQAMPKLGAIFAIELQWAFRIDATSGRCWATYREGGFCMELGCHAADLARFLMGPIRNVSANTLRFNHGRLTEDHTHALLQFDTFATGSIVISANFRDGRHGQLKGRILGDKGRIEFTCYPYAREGNEATLLIDKTKDWAKPVFDARKLPVKTPRSLFEVYPGFYDIYQKQARNFLDAVKGKAKPVCTLEDGRSAVEVVLAIYDEQSRNTREPNFRRKKKSYRSDKTSHPALAR